MNHLKPMDYQYLKKNMAILQSLANFGFPVTDIDLRYFIKCYLNKLGRSGTCFKKNLPCPDWAASIRKRHPTSKVRVAIYIKRVRAAIDEELVDDYFHNLETVLSNVPDLNIWHYDESTLRDDPGASKVICERGKKYVERIIESTKSCISNVLLEWLRGYDTTIRCKSVTLVDNLDRRRITSGWFDMATFENWFMTNLLPRLKKLPDGVKVDK